MTTDTLARSCAVRIHARFCEYHDCFKKITKRAPDRFLNRRWSHAQDDTIERLNLYNSVVGHTETDVRTLLNERFADEALWIVAKAHYAAYIKARDDRDLLETFFNSVTRRLFDTVGVNRRIEFVQDIHESTLCDPTESIFNVFPMAAPLETVFRRIFTAYIGTGMDRASLEKVLPSIVAGTRTRLAAIQDAAPKVCIEMLRHVFYRGQGAYLIGRIVTGQTIIPLVFALLHPPGGVVVDALLLDSDGVSIIFSFTRSAFNVPVEKPRELMGFLKSILPLKSEAELYSSLGYFKHGKTILYREVCRHTAQCTDDQFRISPGKPGMVMAVFDLTGYEMVVKLIRDRFDNPKKVTRAIRLRL
jgi:isocitrate dehydrogenase kinase/phosphatase